MPEPSSRARRICLIGVTAVAHNPRLLKAADALQHAGYQVQVIAAHYLDWAAEFDRRIVAERCWSLQAVSIVGADRASRRRFWRTRLRHLLYRRVLGRISLRAGIAERVNGRLLPELATAAARTPADLYVAHTLRALPAAAYAARRNHARLYYDAEDLHSEELPLDQRAGVEQQAIEYLEARYLPACDLVSVPSALIGAAMARRYGITTPLVIHNVFPWADRQTLDSAMRQRRSAALSVFWFSQTIGLNRGVQDVIRAAGLLTQPIQIHLMGGVSPAVQHELADLARECGVADRLHMHPQVPPEQVLSRAAEHDVGLASELGERHSLSNALTVTNKLFVYMLAGLAIAATATPGQAALLHQAAQVGALYQSGDHQALAAILRDWQAAPQQLAGVRQAALAAAEQRWNWEIERQVLIEAVRQLV